MHDNAMQIINRIESGDLSVEEGLSALMEIGSAGTTLAEAACDQRNQMTVEKSRKARYIKVNIRDEGKRLKFTIPMWVATFGLKIALPFIKIEDEETEKFLKENEKVIEQLLKYGTRGTVIEVYDEDTIVEIYIK